MTSTRRSQTWFAVENQPRHELDEPGIRILLSLYNGAKYLPAQLESFLRQDIRSWRLIWRDDGSQDESRALVQAFSAKLTPGRCIEVTDPPNRLGVQNAYEILLQAVPSGCYVAFADQDDVWFDDKLRRAFLALKACRKPALYFARQYIVDDRLKHRRLSLSLPPGHHLNLAAALTQNLAVGHTILLDPAAVALVKQTLAPEGVLFDWWSFLIVAAFDGEIVTDHLPVSLYRQHGANAVGASSRRLVRGYRAMRRGPKLFMQRFTQNVVRLRQIEAISHASSTSSQLALACSRMFPRENGAFLQEVERILGAPPVQRIRFLVSHGELHRQNLLEHIVFCLWFVIHPARLPSNSDGALKKSKSE